jgi:hypothetical protein
LKRTDEDELCAIHLPNRLEGRPGDPDAIRRLILAGGEVGRFQAVVRRLVRAKTAPIDAFFAFAASAVEVVSALLAPDPA